MFVGALNQKALAWLAQQRECFAGRQVVVGCSGSFSTELMLLQKGVATTGVHGNDVALFSYVLGEYLCGRRVDTGQRLRRHFQNCYFGLGQDWIVCSGG